MDITYDAMKNAANISKHGIAFEQAHIFEWDSCITVKDTRYDYGEQRFISYGFINGRLYVLIWTTRQHGIRIISLRKANAKERKRYEQ